jgi:DNA-binding transcriptional ArsR family regulator
MPDNDEARAPTVESGEQARRVSVSIPPQSGNSVNRSLSSGQKVYPPSDPTWQLMAANAAKFGHCQVRYPVEYRSKVPFRPELAAPLDLSVRSAEIYALDQELDRAVLHINDYSELLWESAAAGIPSTELLASDFDLAIISPKPTVGPIQLPDLEPLRRQFVLNELEFLTERAQFRPPWVAGLIQNLHAILMRRLGLSSRPGEFRTQTHSAAGKIDSSMYRACPPDRILPELNSLLHWVDRVGPTMMPVIPAMMLLYGFHSIRPFPVGNMTLGRVLAQLYLYQFGLPNAMIVPIGQLGQSEPDLMVRLMLWTEMTGSYSELLDYTMDSVLRAYRLSTERWLHARGRSSVLEETTLRILARARRTPGWFSAQEAASWVGGRSDQTVLRHLNALVRRGVVETLGKTRAKRYRLVSEASLIPKLVRRFSLRAGARAEAMLPPGEPANSGADELPPDMPDR